MGIVSIDGIPVYQALVDADDCGMIRISLVDDPAVQSNFLAFSKQERRPQMYAVADSDKHLVFGVVMRADFPIYRRDDNFGEYYIIYKADTIRKMAEKYLVENRQNAVDQMHDGEEVDGVHMVQLFIKDSEKGINPSCFDEVIADGSLFAEFHVTDETIWNEIKEGTFKGFSLEGIFDLTPERDKASVEEIVDALDGIFSRILRNNTQTYEKMKKKGILARLAAMLVEMGNVTTDKGVLYWDGDEDLKEGDSVFTEDAEGNRIPAADGDYVTGDNKTIVVVDGKVSELRDPEAEVAPATETEAEEEPDGKGINTDKGMLYWMGDEDLKEGDEVFVDAEGEEGLVSAPDGEYKTEDGKTIVVAEGKVSEIKEAEAEADDDEASREEFRRMIQKCEESYNEKSRVIAEAIAATLGEKPFYIVDAGDDFAVISTWEEDEVYVEKYFRYAVSWNEDGSANVADPVEVKSMFVPVDFVSPFDKGDDPSAEEALRKENEELRNQLEELKRKPAAKPAHETFEGSVPVVKTGNKGLDRLARIASAK